MTAILIKRTSESGIPYNAPAGANVGELCQFYLQGDVKALGNITGNVALDFTDVNVIRNQFSGTLTGNVNIAFTDPPAPMHFHVVLAQNATGGYSVGWPAGVDWLNGAGAPSMPTDAGDEAIYSFLFTGSRYIGQMGVLGFAELYNYILANGRVISWSDDGSFNPLNYIVGIGPAGNFGTANSQSVVCSQMRYYTDNFILGDASGDAFLGVGADKTFVTGSDVKCILVTSNTNPPATLTNCYAQYSRVSGGGVTYPAFKCSNGEVVNLLPLSGGSYNNFATLADLVNCLKDTGLIKT